ncbi:MAG: ABC transporter permease subunit [bacterium]|nr:ABC transporter permease subunit [bacterium]
MTGILVIAKTAFLESIRGRKILHVLLIVSVLIIAWASTLHVFALGVQVKFIKDVCLSAISIFGTLIALAVSCGQLPNEIENRTIYPLLAKPVRRSEIIIGKFLGAVYIIFLNVFLMSAIFLAILALKERAIDFAIVEAIYLIGIELMVIAALCIFFSTFFSTAANVSLTFFIYIFGHVKVTYLNYLVGRIDNPVTQFLLNLLYNPILPPNLEYFNIKEAIIWGKLVGLSHLGLVTLYGLFLVFIFLTSGSLIFRKKNL